MFLYEHENNLKNKVNTLAKREKQKKKKQHNGKNRRKDHGFRISEEVLGEERRRISTNGRQ